MPLWLLREGTKVFLRRFVRDKDEPLCDVVELLMANPTYARVRRRDGKETTVSTSDLAPYPNVFRTSPDDDEGNLNLENNQDFPAEGPPTTDSDELNSNDVFPEKSESEANLTDETVRRSTKVRKAPDRFGEWTV